MPSARLGPLLLPRPDWPADALALFTRARTDEPDQELRAKLTSVLELASVA